jgi:hypothetical protein
VREALRELDRDVEIATDYTYTGVRNYRVSGKKLERTLDISAAVGIEESVETMVNEIERHGYIDFDNPRYYNIRWMRLLQEAQGVIQVTGSVFESPRKITPLPRQSSG